MVFRELRADEIECRISTVKQNGVSLLLYKDARCDMNILDETVGPENWQRSHVLINGNLFCNVGININFGTEKDPAWVYKQDVGKESYAEKEKGQASDSFKRACFNWGIGRELYTAPFIRVPAERCNIVSGAGGKVSCYDRFRVEQIIYEDGKIAVLSIINKNKKIRAFYIDLRKDKA